MERGTQDRPGFISSILYLWVTPLIRHGRHNTLQQDDTLPYASVVANGSRERGARFLLEYARLQGFSRFSKTLKTLINMLGRQYFFAAAGKPFWLCSALAQVFCVRALVDYVSAEGADGSSRWKYIPLCLALFLSATGMSLGQHAVFFHSIWCGTAAKSALVSAMYRKAARLPPYNARDLGILHTVDTQRITECILYFHFVWFGIIEILVICGLLFWVLGGAAAFGLLFMVLMGPIQVWMSRAIAAARANVSQYADERVRDCSELLGAIRLVKLSCLEELFAQKIQKTRGLEINALMRATTLKAVNSALFFTIPTFVSLVSFCAYVFVFDKRLTPTAAFSAVGFFNVLARVLNMLPYGLISLSEAAPSLKRLDAFFDLEELSSAEGCQVDMEFCRNTPLQSRNSHASDDDKLLEEQRPHGERPSAPILLHVENGCFGWYARNGKRESSSEQSTDTSPDLTRAPDSSKLSVSAVDLEPVLLDVSLQLGRGEMVACIGAVGSGKSSLLLALLREMPQYRGKCSVFGRVAYCAQSPWILNATLRENIIMFGQQEPVDEDRYVRALHACSLMPDLELLQNGDLTEIGERGVTLSGGQKARVALARAIYADCDVYLLDDPLSAVDAATSKQLRTQLFGSSGVLSEKSVLLVTHNFSVLPLASRVIVMDSGRIKYDEPYQDLLRSDVKFEGIIENESDDEHGNEGVQDSSAAGEQESAQALLRRLHSARESEKTGGVTTSEERRIGKVSRSVYRSYFQAAGGFWPILMLITAFILSQAGRTGSDWWIGIWSSDKLRGRGDSFYALVFLALAMAAVVFGVARATIFSGRTTCASRTWFVEEDPFCALRNHDL